MVARNVEEAVALAEKWRTEGRYDWFRGQPRPWRVRSSLHRLPPSERQGALERLARFRQWVHETPGVEALAADDDAMLAVAQHYGISTPYIDFTRDPRVAGFFALAGHGPTVAATSDDTSDYGCIVCVDHRDYMQFMQTYATPLPPHPLVMTPHVSDLWRLEAQRGVFVWEWTDLELYYDFDRVIFPRGPSSDGLRKEEVYPPRRSGLEILLDQFFALDRTRNGALEFYRWATDRGVRVVNVAFDPDAIERSVLRMAGVSRQWNRSRLRRWLQTPPDSHHGYSRSLRVRATLNRTSQASVAAVVRGVRRVLAAQRDARQRELRFEFSSPSQGDEPFVGAVAQRLERLWDGMRRLPYSDEQIVSAVRNTMRLATASRRLQGPEPVLFPEDGQNGWWKSASQAVLGDCIELEFSANDGTTSRARVSRRALKRSVRTTRRVTRETRLERNELSLEDLLLAVPDPSRLFKHADLAQLFAEQIIPSQVLTRPEIIFYSPARLITLGLP